MTSCHNCSRPISGPADVCRRAESCPVATGDVDPDEMPANTWRARKDGER